MPSPGQILAGLKTIANSWTTLAIVWHVFFGAIIVAVILGSCPREAVQTGFMLIMSYISVTVAAWRFGNPFNGVVFGLITVLAIVIGVKMQCRKAELSPLLFRLTGAAMFLFGWAYPHFLETDSFVRYLYAAPTGLIPCPTLSIAIGLVLVLNGLWLVLVLAPPRDRRAVLRRLRRVPARRRDRRGPDRGRRRAPGPRLDPPPARRKPAETGS